MQKDNKKKTQSSEAPVQNKKSNSKKSKQPEKNTKTKNAQNIASKNKKTVLRLIRIQKTLQLNIHKGKCPVIQK